MLKCLRQHTVSPYLPCLCYTVSVVVWLSVATATATVGFPPRAAACD